MKRRFQEKRFIACPDRDTGGGSTMTASGRKIEIRSGIFKSPALQVTLSR
jgi:hypothetical protein